MMQHSLLQISVKSLLCRMVCFLFYKAKKCRLYSFSPCLSLSHLSSLGTVLSRHSCCLGGSSAFEINKCGELMFLCWMTLTWQINLLQFWPLVEMWNRRKVSDIHTVFSCWNRIVKIIILYGHPWGNKLKSSSKMNNLFISMIELFVIVRRIKANVEQCTVEIRYKEGFLSHKQKL